MHVLIFAAGIAVALWAVLVVVIVIDQWSKRRRRER
jgi:hypothetical protein